MKNFILSSLVFIVIAILAIANSIFICATTDKLTQKLESLPDSEEKFAKAGDEEKKEYEELYRLWDDSKFFIGLSVNSKRIEDIDEHLLELKVRLDSGSFTDYKNARQLVNMLLGDLKHKESLSLDNVV